MEGKWHEFIQTIYAVSFSSTNIGLNDYIECYYTAKNIFSDVLTYIKIRPDYEEAYPFPYLKKSGEEKKCREADIGLSPCPVTIEAYYSALYGQKQLRHLFHTYQVTAHERINQKYFSLSFIKDCYLNIIEHKNGLCQ